MNNSSFAVTFNGIEYSDMALLRKATLKWEKEQAGVEAIEKKRSLAKSALGEMYYRYSMEQSLLIAKTDDVESLSLLNDYKDALPDSRVLGKVSVHSKGKDNKTGESLLGLLIAVRNVETKVDSFMWYAVGQEIKERVGKTTVSVGSILVKACLADHLNAEWSKGKDFPSLKPVEEISLVDGNLQQAA